MPLRTDFINIEKSSRSDVIQLFSQSNDSLVFEILPYFFYNGIDFTFDYIGFFSAYPTVGYVINNSTSITLSSFPSQNFQIDNITFSDFESMKSYLLGSSSNLGIKASSLNGDYYSFNDGESVYTFPDNRNYHVSRSYLVYSGEASHILMYDLVDSDNKIISCPHTFCSKIVPVV